MEPTQLLYIDPAATTALISSLTAIVVAVGASGIVIWRKFKKKVDKTLNKDPNANKEVEDELVINDEETAVETAAEVPAEAPAETAVEVPAKAPAETAAEEAPAATKPKTAKKKTK